MNTCLAPAILNPGLIQTNAASHDTSSDSSTVLRNREQEILLKDGRQATIRPICSHDKSAIMAFHNRLSEDTRFLRYHYSKGQLTEKDLQDICDVDYQKTLALVVETEQNGHREIIGIGNFIRLSFDHTAEVAFTVQDNEQNQGIGTQLLKHLSVLAWQRDIYYFFGEVLRHNGRMLSIFRKADPQMKQEIDSASTCTVTLSVVEAMHRIP